MSNLKPLEKELQALQKQLKNEQQQWEIKRSSLSREVQRLKALIPTLEHKATSWSDKIANLENEFARLTQQNKHVMARLEKLGNLERKKETIVKELDSDIESKTEQLSIIRTDVDTKLAKYESDRRTSIEKELSSQNTLLEEARKIYAELKEKVGNKRDELNAINEAIVNTNKLNEQAIESSQKKIADLKLEVDKLEAETEEARSELAKLYREKAVVASDTRKAEDRHKQFIEYEQKARKELETKSTALLRKQEELGQEERFIKARRSILPEM